MSSPAPLSVSSVADVGVHSVLIWQDSPTGPVVIGVHPILQDFQVSIEQTDKHSSNGSTTPKTSKSFLPRHVQPLANVQHLLQNSSLASQLPLHLLPLPPVNPSQHPSHSSVTLSPPQQPTLSPISNASTKSPNQTISPLPRKLMTGAKPTYQGARHLRVVKRDSRDGQEGSINISRVFRMLILVGNL